MIHNSSVHIRLIHFQLWIKRSHQSPNFEIFESSGINLPNFSCHFPNQKLAFLQILHHSTLSWNILPLYFRSSIIYFAQNFEFLETTNQFLIQILHHSSVSWDITPLYFFSWNFTYFQQKESIKVQIWWNFTWAVEGLKFSTLICTDRGRVFIGCQALYTINTK